MKVSAPHRGWTSGRATPSLRPTPYAAETANPAGRHLSFAEICPDNRSQLLSRLVAVGFADKQKVRADGPDHLADGLFRIDVVA